MATLARSKHPRERLFVSIPLLFALHQFAEGAVWLGLAGDGLPGGIKAWGFAYMLYAQGLLTLLIPLSVWLIEPARKRRLMVLPFLVLGAVLTVYMLWALVKFPTAIYVEGRSVVYSNRASSHLWIAVLYVVATCGALLFSGYRYIMLLGAANLAGVLLTIWMKQYAFTSVWCAYAAVVSVLVYFHFSRRRRAEKYGRVLEH